MRTGLENPEVCRAPHEPRLLGAAKRERRHGRHGEEIKEKEGGESPVGTAPGANRSLLSHRTPILIRTRSMQAGWMPASSPVGTTGRYDACNLFLLPPIFFLPLDQLLLISRRSCLCERHRKYLLQAQKARATRRGHCTTIFVPEISSYYPMTARRLGNPPPK